MEARPLELSASPGRRGAAVLMLALLGLALIWLGVGETVGLAGLGLVGFGVLILVFGEALRRSTGQVLLLGPEGLVTSGGLLLAGWDEIVKVERGTFSFKPTNGFALILKGYGPVHWSPGLWWRMGRRLGIGGVTPPQAGKAMAEEIALRVAAMGKVRG